MVEWGGAAFTATSVWQRMGQLARITNCRIREVEKLLSIWQAQIWANEPVGLLVGTAWNLVEVVDFQTEISRVRPKHAVLVTPSHLHEFKDLPPNWADHFWVDGSCTGDLVGGCWNVFFRCKEKMGEEIKLSGSSKITTFEEAYQRVDKLCAKEEDLPLKRFKIEESEGFVVLQSSVGVKRLPRLSQYPPVSRGDVVEEKFFPLELSQRPVMNLRKENKL